MSGRVPVGGDAPITVQTMTNTPTTDVAATVAQIRRAERGGRGHRARFLPRPAESALALKEIVRQVDVPIVADIHFHYKRAIEAAESGRRLPAHQPRQHRQRRSGCARWSRPRAITAARCASASTPARWRSTCWRNTASRTRRRWWKARWSTRRSLQDHDFHEFKISVKASDVFLAVAAYQQLAEVCDHPLHIGITEAGGRRTGTVKSAIGLGNLLWAGIGDTVRVSLSAEPEEEVRVGWEMLKSLGIRHRGVRIISCPSCARQGFDVIRTVQTLEERLAHIETPLTLSIIGCVVNGPGEALMTDLGVTGGGAGRHMVYAAGKTDHTVPAEAMIEHIVELVERKAAALAAEQTKVAAE